MAEARYQDLRKLIEGKEEVLSNGNKVVNGEIGNYRVQLELRNLLSSGQQILLNLDDYNNYGRRVLRHWQLYENGSTPYKEHTERIENEDPEFFGKLKHRCSYSRKKTLDEFIVSPSILATFLYFLSGIQGADSLSSIELSAIGTTGYLVLNTGLIIKDIIKERKKAISRIKIYDQLKKLIP